MRADFNPRNTTVQHPNNSAFPVKLRYRAAASIPVGAVTFFGGPVVAWGMHARHHH